MHRAQAQRRPRNRPPRRPRRHYTGQTSLTRSEHDYCLSRSSTAVETSPLEPIAEGYRHGGDVRRDARRDPVHHGSRMQIEVLRKAAPQRRFHTERSGPVADRAWHAAVRSHAGAELSRAAILAVAAGQVFLERDEVPFLDAPAIPRHRTQALDNANHLVAEDARPRIARKIHRPVAATHAGGQHSQDSRVGTEIGEGQLVELRLARSYRDGCQGFSHAHLPPSKPGHSDWHR